ncbi:ABC transporter permease [Marinobacter sp.]|uniref:ABC transporter permease n=1 Tax=Marinobacter sp. TaxID=50741 RepID=UPI00384D2CB8
MTLLPALLSHYRRHPLQLLALALIIVLATGLWTGVWELTRQARHSMEQSEEAVAARYQVIREDSAEVTVEDFVRLRRRGVCVTPWLEVERPAEQGRVIGVDVLSMGCLPGVRTGDSDQGAQLADVPELNGKPFVDIAEAVNLSADTGESQFRLLVAPENAELPESYVIRPVPGGITTGELADSFLLNLNALCVLVLLITALLVRSVYNLGLVQRRASLALLRRYGVPAGQLQRYLIGELAVLALLAAVPGVMLGQLLAQVFASGFGDAMVNLFSVRLYAGGSQWMSWLLAMLAVAVVVVWCAFDALTAAARAKAEVTLRFPLMRLGLSLILLGLLGVVWSMELWQVFVAVALLLAGVGLVTPRLLSGFMGWLAARARDSLTLWSCREMAVMLRRLALPAVALQFAVATVIAIQALVTTFESTFLNWLDQRLQGDIYIQVPAGRSGGTAVDYLESADGVLALHRSVRGSVTLDGAETDLLALDPESDLLEAWEFLESVPRPWKALTEGGVMVNEQLAFREDVGAGDTIGIGLGGTLLSREVVAVYADYGRPVGEVLLPHEVLPPDFQPRSASISVQLEEGVLPGLREQLGRIWQTGNLQIRDNSQVRQLATGVFEQTFFLTRAISLMTVVLAGLSLLLMGWVFFSARAWYYQLLQIWGLSDRSLHRRLQWQAVGLTVLVALAALPTGIFLTWVLVARINPLAFGWSLPMAVYPAFWLEILALCGAIGLSIAWLVRRQIRGFAPAPVAATQIEGAER